jgi:hypothetical protein
MFFRAPGGSSPVLPDVFIEVWDGSQKIATYRLGWDIKGNTHVHHIHQELCNDPTVGGRLQSEEGQNATPSASPQRTAALLRGRTLQPRNRQRFRDLGLSILVANVCLTKLTDQPTLGAGALLKE